MTDSRSFPAGAGAAWKLPAAVAGWGGHLPQHNKTQTKGTTMSEIPRENANVVGPLTVDEALGRMRACAQGSSTARPNLTPPISQFSTPEARLAERQRLAEWADMHGPVLAGASLALEGIDETGARVRCRACMSEWTIATDRGPDAKSMTCPSRCNRHSVDSDLDMGRAP